MRAALAGRGHPRRAPLSTDWNHPSQGGSRLHDDRPYQPSRVQTCLPSLHVAPVARGRARISRWRCGESQIRDAFSKVPFVLRPRTILALACPDTPVLALALHLLCSALRVSLAAVQICSRQICHSNHSYGYGLTPGILPFAPAGPRKRVQDRSRRSCRSRAASNRTRPARSSRILVQFAG